MNAGRLGIVELALTEGGDEGVQDPFEELSIPEEIKEELKSSLRRRLAPQPIKIRADVEVSCFTYEGIDAIHETLFAGIGCGGGRTLPSRYSI